MYSAAAAGPGYKYKYGVPTHECEHRLGEKRISEKVYGRRKPITIKTDR